MLTPPRKGDLIPADIGRQILRALKALTFQVVWPLVYDETANTITYQGPDDVFYIRITGLILGGYAWHEIRPVAGGGWVDGPASGGTSDPAVELNGNTDILTYTSGTDFRTEAWRDAAGTLRFRAGKCPPCP